MDSSLNKGMMSKLVTTKNSLSAAAGLSFIINLLLSASMNLLWSMMNTLQIIVHLPLVNLTYPSNAMLFSSAFLTLAQFDILPHSFINPRLLHFSKN